MQRTIAMLAMGFVLALAPLAALAKDPSTTEKHHEKMAHRQQQHLEQLMVENADTPAEHEALARYYRGKAQNARSLAEEHRSMGKSYAKNAASRRTMVKHCDRIAKLNDELAVEFESLADGEDAAAGE